MKKNFKKFFLLVAVIVTAVVCFAFSASAADLAENGQCGNNVYWSYNKSTGELVISGTGPMWNYESNDDNRSPFYKSNINSIVISEGVTTIGDRVFADCDRLTEVIIPNSIITIGSFAFRYCDRLTEVTIPDSVIAIDGSAFQFCDSLTKVTIGNGVTTIDSYIFQSCEKLTEVILGDSVTTIGERAFDSCDKLTKITIPDSVITIGEYAFSFCYDLTDVYYGGTMNQWKKISIDFGNSSLTKANIHCIPSRETFAGKLEDCVFAVVIDGPGQWINKIKVDGETYDVEANLLPVSFADNKGKTVIVTIDGEKVVSCITKEEIRADLSLSISPYNTNITYSKNKYSSDSVDLNVILTNALNSSFNGDKSELENISELSKIISTVKLTSSNSKLVNFGGNATLNLTDFNSVKLDIGGSESKACTANVNTKYKISDNLKKEIVNIKCEVTYVESGELKSTNISISIEFDNYNYSPKTPEKTEEESNTESKDLIKITKSYKDTVKKVSDSLDGINALVLTPDFVTYEIMTNDMVEALQQDLLCRLVMSTVPSKDFDTWLSEEVMKKIFPSTSYLGMDTYDIEQTYYFDSPKYGPIEITFTTTVSKYSFKKYGIASMGDIYYTIKGEMPEKYKNGKAGMGVTANVDSFCEAMSELMQSAIKNAYNKTWGDNANEVAEMIFDKNVINLISYSKYGSFSDMFYESMCYPTKKFAGNCPIDINVYDEQGNLSTSIKNNEVVLNCDKAYATIDGETKIIILSDEDYIVEIVALGDSRMDVTIEEYANASGLIRTVNTNNIELEYGKTYSSNVTKSLLCEIDLYNITSSGDKVFEVDENINHLHTHTEGEWSLVTKESCKNYGKKICECLTCERTIVSFIEPTPHTFTEKIIDSAHLVSVATTNSPAVYRYDCANCDEISEDLTFTHGDKLVSLGKTSKITPTQTTKTVKLTWKAVSGANIYRVYQKNGSSWKKLADVTSLNYTVKNLKAGTKYSFAVKAGKKVDGKITWASGYTSINTATKAVAPSKITATQTASTIKLTWNKVSGATGYRIYYKSGNTWKVTVNSTTATSHTFKNLKAGAKFTFAVKPYIKTDSGVVWSAYKTFTTSTVPANPTAKVTAPSKGKLTVTWSAVKGADAYQLWYKTGNGSYKLYKTYTKAGTLNFKNLKSGTKYTFAVRAVIKTDGGNVRSGYKAVSATVK